MQKPGKEIFKFVATGAYLGYSPFAPGTVGTLWGVAIAFFISSWPLYLRAILTTASIIISIVAAEQAKSEFTDKDPRQIVCDEVCGLLVAFFLIPYSVLNLTLAFIFFRFFDIVKPYPVNFIDKKLGGGLGITLDDVMAGIYANIALRALIELTALRG